MTYNYSCFILCHQSVITDLYTSYGCIIVVLVVVFDAVM